MIHVCRNVHTSAKKCIKSVAQPRSNFYSCNNSLVTPFLPVTTQRHFNFSTGKSLTPNKMYVRERADKNEKLDNLASVSKLKWKIQGGMLCSRPPVITPDIEEWEERYFYLLDKKERATFSDYETSLYPRMKGKIDYGDDEETAVQQQQTDEGNDALAVSRDSDDGTDANEILDTVPAEDEIIDIDDLLEREIDYGEYGIIDEEDEEENFEEEELDDGFGSRITEADVSNDRTTVNRRLQKYVYLLVKKKDPESDQIKWFFPRMLKPDTNNNGNSNSTEVEIDNNRSLKDFAVESIGNDVGIQVQDKLYVYGNGPSAYHIEEYNESKKAETGYFGVKTFFYKSQVWGQAEDPPIVLNSDVLEYAWVAQDEIEEYLKEDDEDFAKYMSKVLW